MTKGTLHYAKGEPQVAARAATRCKPGAWGLALTALVCGALSFYWVQNMNHVAHKKQQNLEYQLHKLKMVELPYVQPGVIIQTLKLESAYAMTHVEFNQFNRHQTNMPGEESYYLEQMFDLVNLGVVERMEWFSTYNSNPNYEKIYHNYSLIMMQMKNLKPSKRLERAHYLILNAVKDEYDYFQNWKHNPNYKFNARDELVQSADQKLRDAYAILMDTYADEDEKTRKSFYSHLCALSFI